MFCLKKMHGDELFQLALVLSLLRVDYESLLGLSRFRSTEYQEIMLGTSSAYTQNFHNFHNRLNEYIHPKSIDSMILNQQSIFYELNSLGRYNHYEFNREITTYLLNEQEQTSHSNDTHSNDPPAPEAERNNSGPTLQDHYQQEQQQQQEQSADDHDDDDGSHLLLLQQPSSGGDEETQSNGEECSTDGTPSDYSGLTEEDMDLIEVLLKQDIDLGVTREVFDLQLRRELEKLEELEEKEKKEPSSTENVNPVNNPWDGLNYTIDSETGEHIILPENEESGLIGDFDPQLPLIEEDLLTIASEFENLPLNDTFQLTEFGKSENSEESKPKCSSEPVKEDSLINSLESSSLFAEIRNNLSEGLEEQLEGMIQTQFHMHPHGRLSQARVPYLRTISMEQRWQDLANILSLPLAETEMHGSLAMVHGQPHNFTSANSPYSSIDNCSTILLRNASLAPPLPEISNNVTFSNDIAETPNLATAVASSISTLTNSSEPMGDSSCQSTYNTDGNTLVYPHNHSEINQTTEGFLSSILNDEDLQLMDMAMNEVPYAPNDRYVQNQHVPGMYTLKMLDNDEGMETSSDSAVSSMASSERVSSLSDSVQNNCCHNGWGENASDSAHPEEQNRYFGIEYSQASLPSKYRPYEYYPPRPTLTSNNSDSNNSTEASSLHRPIQPVAQKKYQLFGKRFPPDPALGGSLYGNPGRNSNIVLSEPIKYSEYPYDRSQNDRTGRPSFEMIEGATALDPPEVKFSCSMEFARQHVGERPIMEHVQHNHTYGLPPESLGNPQKPSMRDKQKRKLSEEEALSRDEKRARSLKIPMTNSDIINLPMDEFNERLSKFDLTEAQLALIRDIRRRGKNKVAAQNCRKRKLDQIVSLADEVQNLQEVKDTLMRDHQNMMIERQRLKDKFTQLYRHVFQALRDPDGHPYSTYEYSLQQASNGNVMLVPQNGTSSLELDPLAGAKAKKKDEPTD